MENIKTANYVFKYIFLYKKRFQNSFFRWKHSRIGCSQWDINLFTWGDCIDWCEVYLSLCTVESPNCLNWFSQVIIVSAMMIENNTIKLGIKLLNRVRVTIRRRMRKVGCHTKGDTSSPSWSVRASRIASNSLPLLARLSREMRTSWVMMFVSKV